MLSKYVTPEARFIKEKEVDTKVGRFRVDLVLELPDKRTIGIECDGVDFHDPVADLFRDSLILGSSAWAAMYRFPGRVLSSYPDDAVYLLSLWEPTFFNDRIDAHRELLATDEVKNAYEQNGTNESYPYLFEWLYRGESNSYLSVNVIRHKFGLKNPPVDSPDRIWEFSQKSDYRSIETLAEEYAKVHPTKEWRGWGYFSQGTSTLFNTLDAKYFKKE